MEILLNIHQLNEIVEEEQDILTMKTQDGVENPKYREWKEKN